MQKGWLAQYQRHFAHSTGSKEGTQGMTHGVCCAKLLLMLLLVLHALLKRLKAQPGQPVLF